MIVTITQKEFDAENGVWNIVAIVESDSGTSVGPYSIEGTEGTRESTLIKHIKASWGVDDN